MTTKGKMLALAGLVILIAAAIVIAATWGDEPSASSVAAPNSKIQEAKSGQTPISTPKATGSIEALTASLNAELIDDGRTATMADQEWSIVKSDSAEINGFNQLYNENEL